MAGRPKKFNLEPMQDRLRELIHDMNYSVTEIRKIMAEEAGVTIDDIPSTSTIRRKLRDWNIRIKDQPEDVQESALRSRDQPQASLYEDPALIDTILELRSSGLRTKKMMEYLKEYWPQMSNKQLKLRHRAEIYLRGQEGKREEEYEQVKAVVEKTLKSGETGNFRSHTCNLIRKGRRSKHLSHAMTCQTSNRRARCTRS